MTSYRNKIIEYVKLTYGITPEYLWEKFPTFAIFRNTKNRKWFGVVMRLPKSKLGLGTAGDIEVLNIKCDQLGIFQLLDENNGFLPAYHMNKKHWISVLLNGSVEFDRITNLLKMSYDLVDKNYK